MLLAAENYREFLDAELVRRMRANPRYSQRAFARQLGLSPGELSEILRGRRPLTLKGATRIAKALGLSPAETARLVRLVLDARGVLHEASGAETVGDPADAARLSLDLFNVVGDWYCFAILHLAECEGFRWDEAWIARRLGISPAEARLAKERLLRVGLLERRGGKIRVAHDTVITPDGVPSEAIRNCHRQLLARASRALDTQPIDQREIRGVTMAVDPALLPELKREAAEALRRVTRKFSSKGKPKEVYHLGLALFRLSEGETYGH